MATCERWDEQEGKYEQAGECEDSVQEDAAREDDYGDVDPEGPDADEIARLDDDDDEAETVECPGCGRAVYEHADRCPHCGQWVSDADVPTFKPWVMWLAVGLVVILLALALGGYF